MNVTGLMLLLLTVFCSPGVGHWECRLDSDDFRVRERASRSLYDTGSLREIRTLAKSAQPEVRNRAQFVYSRRKADVMNSLKPFPFIDSMWYSVSEHAYRYDSPWSTSLDKYLYGRIWVSSNTPFAGYREASAVWASDMFDAGVPEWAIRLLFWELHRRDEDFLRRFGYKQPER